MTEANGAPLVKPSSTALAALIAEASQIDVHSEGDGLNLLIDAGKMRRYAKGREITSRYAEDPIFYIVLEGRVRLTSTSSSGAEFLASFLGPGELFGFHSAFSDDASIFDSVAEDDVVVLTYSAAKIYEVVSQHPQLMKFVIKFLTKRLGKLTEVVEHFALWKPSQQLAWRILDLAHASARAGRLTANIRLSISQDDLSFMIGKTRQTTNKLIKQLEDFGLIKTDYRSVIVIDLAQLEDFVAERS